MLPIVGRLTDMVGVRKVALVGVTTFPLTFVAYSMTLGRLVMFAVITVAQNLLAGAATLFDRLQPIDRRTLRQRPRVRARRRGQLASPLRPAGCSYCCWSAA